VDGVDPTGVARTNPFALQPREPKRMPRVRRGWRPRPTAGGRPTTEIVAEGRFWATPVSCCIVLQVKRESGDGLIIADGGQGTPRRNTLVKGE